MFEYKDIVKLTLAGIIIGIIFVVLRVFTGQEWLLAAGLFSIG
jgi:hypothetical protein